MVGFPSYQRSPNRLGLRRATSTLSRQTQTFSKRLAADLAINGQLARLVEMARARGIEPPTFRLTAGRSAIELRPGKGRVRVRRGNVAPHSGPQSTIPLSISCSLVETQSSSVAHLGAKSLVW